MPLSREQFSRSVLWGCTCSLFVGSGWVSDARSLLDLGLPRRPGARRRGAGARVCFEHFEFEHFRPGLDPGATGRRPQTRGPTRGSREGWANDAESGDTGPRSIAPRPSLWYTVRSDARRPRVSDLLRIALETVRALRIALETVRALRIALRGRLQNASQRAGGGCATDGCSTGGSAHG